MQRLQLVQDKTVDFYRSHPRTAQAAAGLLAIYVLKKIASTYWYSRKLLSSTSDCENKVVLITGCDTGFGHATALKLSMVCGFRVIATCLKQESVDEFLSNAEFTKNGSTATVMDVTNLEDIKRAKEFTAKYLSQTNTVFWGLVNNAGITINGEFELVPTEFDEMERNILLTGPINITRQFLPLIHGRKNYQSIQATKTANNGGRIVNITSLIAYLVAPNWTRYGVSKAGLAYFSHTLRMELSPRFGIWVNEVAPGGFDTAIVRNVLKWNKRVQDKLAEKNQSHLLQVYDSLTVDEMDQAWSEQHKDKRTWSPNIDPVINCIIHGLTAKYPERTYRPHWVFPYNVAAMLPFWITEPILYWHDNADKKRARAH